MKIKIVMAEDNQDIGRLAFFKLKRDGFEVTWEQDGRSALQKILLNPPDLVILDINMPVMDGYEVYEKLREKDKTRKIPVIFMTALGERQDVVKGIRLGVDDYIVKPFEPKVLSHRVRKVLGLEETEDDEEQDRQDEEQPDEGKKLEIVEKPEDEDESPAK